MVDQRNESVVVEAALAALEGDEHSTEANS
jgi:hypothetical protein